MVILLQLFMIDNCADDWRIAMTWQRMMQIGKRESDYFHYIYKFHSKIFQSDSLKNISGMELLVCAVHPVPGRFYFLWTTKLSNHGGKIGSQWVPVDVTLSLPMFLRSELFLSSLQRAPGSTPGPR